MQRIDEREGEVRSTLLVRSQQSFLVPYPGAEEGEEDDLYNSRYLALTHPCTSHKSQTIFGGHWRNTCESGR